MARAGLLQLREGIGLPERGILRAIGERFTVSVVLAILLAALAIASRRVGPPRGLSA